MIMNDANPIPAAAPAAVNLPPHAPEAEAGALGCVLLAGPGEAEGADVAVFAGKGKGIIYVQGEQKRTVPEAEMLDALRCLEAALPAAERNPVRARILEMHKATLDPRSFTIASFALCGFANISSVGIQIGGIGALAPERKHDLARLGFRAMLAGTLANFMSATIAGLLL